MQTSDGDGKFRRLLLESIDETTHILLGDKPHRVLFERLGNDFHLKREEIPNRLGDFQTALTALLGAGSPVLVRAIIRKPCSKLGIPFVRKDEYDFEAYVPDCMHRYLTCSCSDAVGRMKSSLT